MLPTHTHGLRLFSLLVLLPQRLVPFLHVPRRVIPGLRCVRPCCARPWCLRATYEHHHHRQNRTRNNTARIHPELGRGERSSGGGRDGRGQGCIQFHAWKYSTSDSSSGYTRCSTTRHNPTRSRDRGVLHVCRGCSALNGVRCTAGGFALQTKHKPRGGVAGFK